MSQRKTETQWFKEPAARLEGSRPLDATKVQAPCIVALPKGGFRLFYTAVGPAKPFRECQGYILSAFSEDGLYFKVEPGIRLAPQPELRHMSRRVLAPSVTQLSDGRWRMYFEARGTPEQPTVICSAVSSDLMLWKHEEGIRLQGFEGVGGPRFLTLPDGGGRLYFFASQTASQQGETIYNQSVASAVTTNGLQYELEPGFRLRDKQTEYDTAGITAAEVIPPQNSDDRWTMFFSAWQDVPPGTEAPLHPSRDPNAELNGASADFGAASIAADMSGYRSRIYRAYSSDGLHWKRADCVIEGSGYNGADLDAVHAEDMSLIKLGEDRFRMYYAACDKSGNWRIASAVSKSL